MLDANDIQVIRELLADERRHTEAMLAEERRRSDERFKEEQKRSDERFAEAQKRSDEKFVRIQQQIHDDMMSVLESDVYPKLQLLAEGHEAILEKITPKSEIENMKADIVVLKEAVRHLSAKLNALQKAQ